MYTQFRSLTSLLFVFLSFYAQAGTITSSLTTSKKVQVDSTAARQLFLQGDSILQAGYFRQASDLYQQAAAEYRSLGLWDRVASSYERAARSYSKMGLDSLSLAMSNKVLEECRPHLDSNHVEIAKSHAMKGSTLTYLGQFDDAIANFKQAEAIVKTYPEPTAHVLANVYSGLGTVKHYQRDLDGAIANYYKSLEVRIAGYGKVHAKTAWCYTAIGLAYYEIGNFGQAFKHLKRSQEITTELVGEDHPSQAGTYQVLGAVMANMGNYEQAFIYLEKAVNLVQSTMGKNHPWAAEILNAVAKYHIDLEAYAEASKILEEIIENTDKDHGLEQLVETYTVLCNIKNKMGAYEEALDNGRQAMKAWQRRKDSDSTKVAKLYYEYAQVYENQGQLDQAVAFASRSVDIYTRYYQGKNVAIANVANYLAGLYMERGDLEKAKLAIKQAESGNKISDVEAPESAALKSTQYLSQKQRLESIRLMAQLHEERYLTTKDQQNLELAGQTFLVADTLIQEMRSNLIALEDKVNFLRVVPKIYEQAIDVNFEMFLKTDQEEFRQAMFNYSERNKSSILKESARAEEIIEYSGIPDSLLDREVSLKSKLSHVRSEYQKASTAPGEIDTALVAQYKNEIFDLNLEQEQLRALFKAEYPNYYHQTINQDLSQLSTIQETLDDNSTILEYFVGDSSIYTFVITSSDLFVYQQSKPEGLADKISSFQKAIIQSEFDGYYKGGRELYQLLFEPIRDKVVGDQLIVIPDGALWYVNFDLLLSADRSTVHYRELDYLMKDYAISYAYSADLLVQDFHEKKTPKPGNGVLAFSFSGGKTNESGNRVGLNVLRDSSDDLPGSREEIRAISELVEGDYYYGTFADEAHFKANAGDYSILHLAVHGEVNEKYPMNSSLQFTSVVDSVEDGSLYTYELYNMSLNADLAVLSACNTGSGQIVNGEGVMSLGRGFSYAGCRSLVLTQWAVSDEATPEIMKTFYQGLKAGLNKDRALQKAKLEYLENAAEPKSSPLYWGAFVFLGDASSIQFNGGLGTVNMMAILAVGLVLLGVAIRKRKRSRDKEQV